MKVELTHGFIKIYKRRFSSKPSIHKRFKERLYKFTQNPDDNVLLNHALGGKMSGFRSFSVTGDIRIVYYIYEDTAYFVDIGTHNQVYGK